MSSNSDPEPGDVDPTLQARQRLLAEAALLNLDPGASHSLVVAAPRGWDPGPGWFAAAFFEGLQTSWLRLTPASTLLGGAPEPYDGPLRYPEQLRGRELSTLVTSGAKDLLHVATILASLHADAAAADDYDRSIALDVSLHWRSDPVTVSRIIDQQLRHVRHQLAGVSVESAQAVTLSSNNGRFPVTISNQLDRPVTVMLKARPADPALHLKVPDALVVGANERVQVHVDANSDRVGLTTVSVRLATADGHGFGRIKEIKVRTTQYGVVGWVIVAAAVRSSSARRFAGWCAGSAAAAGGGPNRGRGRTEVRSRVVSETGTLLSASAVMAAGTLVSRITGFVRTAAARRGARQRAARRPVQRRATRSRTCSTSWSPAASSTPCWCPSSSAR